MNIKKLLFWKRLHRRWKRWRADQWYKKLRRMLFQMDDKLKNADYSRNERRRILRGLIRDIQGSLSTWLSNRED